MKDQQQGRHAVTKKGWDSSPSHRQTAQRRKVVGVRPSGHSASLEAQILSAKCRGNTGPSFLIHSKCAFEPKFCEVAGHTVKRTPHFQDVSRFGNRAWNRDGVDVIVLNGKMKENILVSLPSIKRVLMPSLT